MFVIVGSQADAVLKTQDEFDSVLKRLHSDGRKPLLRATAESLTAIAGVKPGSIPLGTLIRATRLYSAGEPAIVGEVFFQPDRVLILQPVKSRLTVWEIRHHTTESQVDAFCAAISAAAQVALDGRRLRGMDFAWKPFQQAVAPRQAYRRRISPDAKLEAKPATYSELEAETAKILIDSNARAFLINIAKLGRTRASDAAGGSDAAPAQLMLERGLARKEYLLVCSKDSHTICTFRDKSEIEDRSLNCGVCLRPFKDERTQEILAPTDLGKNLITSSRWMSIWVTELLISAGIDRDQIKWSAASGEDELDIMTDALGLRVFFELKDREFGLGDAYPFAFRAARYGGSYGAVVTTERVAEEARRFLTDQQSQIGVRMRFLERPEGISPGIIDFVDQVSQAGVLALVQEICELIGADFVPVLQAWMRHSGERLKRSSTPAPAPKNPVRPEAVR